MNKKISQAIKYILSIAVAVVLLYFSFREVKWEDFIEGLRTDSLYVPGTNIRISQLLGLVCFIGAGVALLVLSILTRKRTRLLDIEEAAYQNAKKVEAELATAEGKKENGKKN